MRVVLAPTLSLLKSGTTQSAPLRHVGRELYSETVGAVVTRLVACYDRGLLYEILRNPSTDNNNGGVTRSLSYFGTFINIPHVIDYDVALSSPIREHQ